MKHNYTLNKNQRLKSRKEIAALFDGGKAINLFPVRMIYRYGAGEPGLRAGFTASKKKFRRATARSRIRRLMREAWRLNSVDLRTALIADEKQLHVFLIFTGQELPDFSLVEDRVKRAIDRLVVWHKKQSDYS